MTLLITVNDGYRGVHMLAVAAINDLIAQNDIFLSTVSGLQAFVEKPGSCACNLADALSVREKLEGFNDFSSHIFHHTNKIDELVALQDSINAPQTCVAPPVLPTDLRDTTVRDFFSLLEGQKSRLSLRMSAKDIEEVEQQFILFFRDLQVLNGPRENQYVSFEDAWNV